MDRMLDGDRGSKGGCGDRGGCYDYRDERGMSTDGRFHGTSSTFIPVMYMGDVNHE